MSISLGAGIKASITGVFLIVADGRHSEAYAQTDLSLSSNTIDAAVNDNAPDIPYSFKPDICETIEDSLPAETKEFALDDSRFSLLEDWQTREDAKDIFLYRLCHEDKIDFSTDSVFNDIFIRVRGEPWLNDVILPFMQKDPVFYQEIKNSRLGSLSSDNFNYITEFSWLDNSESVEEVFISIVYTEDVFKAIANNPQRAQFIFENYEKISTMPEIDGVVRQAFVNYPIAMLTHSEIVNEYAGIADDIDMASNLLVLAQNYNGAKTLLKHYEEYQYLPESRQIVQAAVDQAPLYFMYLLQSGKVDQALEADGYISIPGDKLKQLAHYKVNVPDLLKLYEFYSHLPEAREIAQSAILTDSVYFITERARGTLNPILAGDRSLEISGASLLDNVRSPSEDTSRDFFYDYYDIYAHLPEAEEIVRTTIKSNPMTYYKFKINGELPERFAYPLLTPTLQDLENFYSSITMNYQGKYQSSKNGLRLLKYYDQFKHMEGARQFAQYLADSNAGDFLEQLRYKDDTYKAVTDAGILPSADVLRSMANRHGTSLLIKTFPIYKSIEGSHEILQVAIDNNPLPFLQMMAQTEALDRYSRIPEELSEALTEVIAENKITLPTTDDIINYIRTENKNFYFGDIYTAYSQISEAPGAAEVLKTAIDANPYSAMRYVTNQIQGQKIGEQHNIAISLRADRNLENSHWPLPIEESARETSLQTFAYLFEAHPEIIQKQIAGSEYGFQAFLALAGDNEQILGFVLSELEKKPMGVFNMLAEAEHRPYIDTLDQSLSTKLGSIAHNAVDILCNDSERENSHLFQRVKVSDMKRMMAPGSWITESGQFPKDDLKRIIVCFIKHDPEKAIEAINENPNLVQSLGTDDEGFRNALIEGILSEPLYFLEETTRNEKTDNYTILDISVSYEQLLEAGQDALSGLFALESRNRPYDALRTTINILNNLHDYSPEIRFALLDKIPDGHYIDLIRQSDSLYYTSTFNFIMDGFLNEIENNPEARAKLWPDKNPFASTPITKILQNSIQFGRMDELLEILTEDEIRLTVDAILDELKSTKTNSDFFSNSFNSYLGSASFNSVLMGAASEIMIYLAEQGANQDIESLLVERFTNERNLTNRTILGIISAIYSENATIESYDEFFSELKNIYTPHISRYTRPYLEAAPLFDEQGRNFQMMVFYDDKDGHSSFSNFKSKYSADNRWSYRDHGQFISYNRDGIHLFANKPHHQEEGNQAILGHIESLEGTLSVLIHRGHSYHVRKTTQYLNDDIQFLWLGSCRSAVIWNYIDEAPNMQFIYSTNIGSMHVNDPLLKNINDTLADGRDVNWLEMRNNASKISGGSKYVESYVFPDGSLEYSLRMVVSLFQGDRELTRNSQNALVDAIYQNSTQGMPMYSSGVDAPALSYSP